MVTGTPTTPGFYWARWLPQNQRKCAGAWQVVKVCHWQNQRKSGSQHTPLVAVLAGSRETYQLANFDFLPEPLCQPSAPPQHT